METGSNSFHGTAFDGHNLKYTWTITLPLYVRQTNNAFSFGAHSTMGTGTHTRDLLCNNKSLSSEFFMSKMCRVKWKMIFQDMSDNGDKCFKIGLRREDSDQSVVNMLCFVEAKFHNSDEPKATFFEFNAKGFGNEYYSEVIRRTPNVQSIFGYTNSSSNKLYISGIISARNCCNKLRDENKSTDKNISQLQQDFKAFFKRKISSDVTLNVRNETLAAHKFVLTARSPFFQRMFSQDLSERQQNCVQIDDIEKSVMEAFLLFLYTGDLEDREFSTVFELYSVADRYEVTTLFDTCRNLLISYITIQTVIPVLKLADMHSDGEMKEFAVKYICDNFSEVETVAEWEELLDTNPRLASYTLKSVSRNISK